MQRVQRGIKRSAKPDIFLSHSSRDKAAALRLAATLNCCAIDVWLDDWELEVGQSLTDEIANAMNTSRFIAILITKSYNTTVWTKTEYKKALARERIEQRAVMLPLILDDAEIPDFLEDKKYIDLRANYFTGITQLSGMVHAISSFRISQALQNHPPQTISDVWTLLQRIGFEPYIVLGHDDFDEMLQHGGELLRTDYATFDPYLILSSSSASEHVKSLVTQLIV